MNLHRTLLLMTCLSVNTSIIAGDIEPPFGIREYATGSAENFVLNDIDGEPFELDSTRGKWVFLHFWASWCGPCREEMPVIQELDEIIADDSFEIVMINTAEDEDTIFEFLGTIGVDMNSLMDTDGEVTEAWKPRGLPATFLIDPTGEVRYQVIGGRKWDTPIYTGFIKRLTESKKEKSH